VREVTEEKVASSNFWNTLVGCY